MVKFNCFGKYNNTIKIIIVKILNFIMDKLLYVLYKTELNRNQKSKNNILNNS